MGVLVVFGDHEKPGVGVLHRPIELGCEGGVFLRGQQPRLDQTADVARGADDVPAQQPLVPSPVVARRVGGHGFVEAAAVAPECAFHFRYSPATAA